MSTDHANTFNANLADGLFGDILDSQNPAKGGNSKVQNTIYGFRCLLFQRDEVDGKIKFMGDGALNNDKSNADTFGLKCDGDSGNKTKRQKWEFRNNIEDICKFKSDTLFAKAGGKKHAAAALECSYPDEGDLADEGLEPNYEYIQTVFTWVCQRANFWDASKSDLAESKTYTVYDPDKEQFVEKTYDTERDYRKAIFINEFEKHFNLNHALVYYLFCEFTALCDNRAKNMFFRSEDVTCEKLLKVGGGEMSIMDAIDPATGVVNADMIDWENSTFTKWITDLYDLDSCYGVENTGRLEIPYYAEWDYELNTKKKFNGHDSIFWLMFEEAFADEIKTKAQTLTNGSLKYDTFYNYQIKDNSLTMCPAVVNRDMEYKYHDPWVDGYVDYSQEDPSVAHNAIYKYLQRGSRIDQKTAFMYRRFNMLYSKYLCNQFTNNKIQFRCDSTVAEEDCIVTLKANQVFYPAVKFGDGEWLSEVKTFPSTDPGHKGVSISKTNGGISGEDFIYIAGASFLTDIGDLSKFYPYAMNLDAATSLKKLIIGSAETGYENAKLDSLDLKNCPLLEEINTFGCINLGTIDLSNNHLIQSVSTSTPVKLPNGGVLKTLRFDKNIASIEVLNQGSLETFDCPDTEDLDNLIKVWVENTPKIPALSIAIGRLNSRKSLSGLRLAGINETIAIEDLMKLTDSSLVLGKFLNEEGKLTDATRYPYIQGTVQVPSLTGEQYNLLKQYYPDLVINYGYLNSRLIFKDAEGNDLTDLEQLVENGVDGSNPGTVLADYDNQQYEYTHIGWSITEGILIKDDEAFDEEFYNKEAFEKVVGDRILYPVFRATTKKYLVTYKNGDTVLTTIEVPYGGDAGEAYIELGYLEPEKSGVVLPELYAFIGWFSQEGTAEYIEGPTILEAQFEIPDQNSEEGLDDGDNLPGYTIGWLDVDYSTNTTDKTMAITKCNNTFNNVIRIPDTMTKSGTDYEVQAVGGFEKHTKLNLVYLPSTLKKLYDSAFAGCVNLSEVTLPTGLETLGQFSFQGTALRSISIPDDVTVIPSNCFKGCSHLNTVSLPIKLEKLLATCFHQCSSLSTITLYEGLTDIMTYVFNGCALTDVTIPASVRNIYEQAFGSMESLETVTFKPVYNEDGSIKSPKDYLFIHKTAFGGSGTKNNPVKFKLPWSKEQHEEAVATGKIQDKFFSAPGVSYDNITFNYVEVVTNV
jgi:hypothetical protein